MPESKPTPATSNEPKIEIKPAKDLEPDESQGENVRGGRAMPGRGFSDVALKTDVSPLRDALAKLRGLQLS